MTQRIKLPNRDPGIRVELGSDPIVEYRMKPVTLEIEEQLDELEAESRRVAENPDSKPIDYAEVELRQLDIVLEAMPRPAGDQKTDPVPSELLLGDVGDPDATPPRPARPGYVTGDVTRAQILSLVSRITQAARPT